MPSSEELKSFSTTLNKHLAARIRLESSISDLLLDLSAHPLNTTIADEQIPLIEKLNTELTDYVANSQLALMPCVQDLQPLALPPREEQATLDNAVGISYMSNVVASMPHSTTACSVLLSLFADRLQLENQVFQSLRTRNEQQVSAAEEVRPIYPSMLAGAAKSTAPVKRPSPLS